MRQPTSGRPLEPCVTAGRDDTMFAALPPFDAGLSIDGLNRLAGHDAVRFVAQTESLLADGLHYEERIARDGVVATREGSTHDLFNALIWLRHTALKRAMNARQVADIARVGPKERTRGQCALTHFDEAGAIVWVDAAAPLAAWDAHDWRALFLEAGDAWSTSIAITLIGHALFDHALAHGEHPVAKALVVRVAREEIVARSRDALVIAWPEAERAVADEIAKGRLLADPQELRPLPLAGLWNARSKSADFLASAPCFRPLRAGRRYPAPLDLATAGTPERPGR
ncbi:MAG TPA: DUF3025 domain-containing protein [Rhodanobacteraceae bacterium]|nr:DUF3025 domain-containing protein [Rhodanobacteraceae bacterium]